MLSFQAPKELVSSFMDADKKLQASGSAQEMCFTHSKTVMEASAVFYMCSLSLISLYEDAQWHSHTWWDSK